MEILKVIVDEIPKGCSSCKLSTHHYYVCLATGKSTTDLGWIKIERPTTRPDWCPLTTRDYITRLHKLAESENGDE